MFDSDSYRELRRGKMYNTKSGDTMSESGNLEDNRAANSLENTEGEVPEIRTLNQEAVNEQIKGFIAPPTRQLEELTPLIQGMVTTPHPSHYPKTDYSTNSGTTAHQPDIQRLELYRLVLFLAKQWFNFYQFEIETWL